ncbi:tousled-Like Kinase family member [Capsaspora owczarzaki ATCC 30864]|uniref:tousled-Like Kinase family member n=1 Tax=Capsaspora owczarzaki (strain ATCC 30864) TaxID=595528 RepID=UPI0003523B9D|nr:tousled-Like Kinase family member [Capsaspora owczarzaki ATCC 30864]|eukprot:XP_004348957.2 tousled-Like Kinase family member [Capsaspora owczarzaki ATCC 30864]
MDGLQIDPHKRHLLEVRMMNGRSASSGLLASTQPAAQESLFGGGLSQQATLGTVPMQIADKEVSTNSSPIKQITAVAAVSAASAQPQSTSRGLPQDVAATAQAAHDPHERALHQQQLATLGSDQPVLASAQQAINANSNSPFFASERSNMSLISVSSVSSNLASDSLSGGEVDTHMANPLGLRSIRADDSRSNDVGLARFPRPDSPGTRSTPASKRKFSTAEDDKIKDGVDRFGEDFDKIRAAYPELDRTSEQLKARYHRSKKRAASEDGLPVPASPLPHGASASAAVAAAAVAAVAAAAAAAVAQRPRPITHFFASASKSTVQTSPSKSSDPAGMHLASATRAPQVVSQASLVVEPMQTESPLTNPMIGAAPIPAPTRFLEPGPSSIVAAASAAAAAAAASPKKATPSPRTPPNAAVSRSIRPDIMQSVPRLSMALQTELSGGDLDRQSEAAQTALKTAHELARTQSEDAQRLTVALRDSNERLRAAVAQAEEATQLAQALKDSEERLRLSMAQADRFMAFIPQLLTAQCVEEKRAAREKCVLDSHRIVSFVMKRRGAEFVEAWQEGVAFDEHRAKMQAIVTQREELDRQRKALTKRKPATPKAAKGGKKDDDSSMDTTADGVFAKPALPAGTVSKAGSAASGTSAQSATSSNNQSLSASSSSDEMSAMELYELDEIIKMRQLMLKKEETVLLEQLEELERDRNLHIRELKRIRDEDGSRFNNNPTLNGRYLLLTLLGKGGFSEVYKAFDLKQCMHVACKIHQVNSAWNEQKKANFVKHACRELKIHESLDHPRIVKLYDVFEIDANSFCTVLEFVGGNDLDFHLKQNKMLPEREARLVLVQLFSALKYLAELKSPVIHYDLKPGNLLLMNGEVKVTDFGLSKIMELDQTNGEASEGMELTSQGAGTYWYLPPECFQMDPKAPPKISSKVDVWSAGVIFYQCLYGVKPFGHNQTQQAILQNGTILNARQVDFPAKPAVSQEAKDFLRRCLMYSKEQRPDVLTLLRDPYLQMKKPPKD